MNTRKVEIEALHILDKFDRLPEITTSSDWDRTLMARLVQSKQSTRSKIYLSTLSVLVVFVILFNAGFVFNTIHNSYSRRLSHTEVYHTLSKELFINQIPNN
jgi:hypothetical protein